jgi:peroxiredoxin Q/BCP
MRVISALLASTVLATALSAQQIAPPKTNLKVGDEAPDFTLPDTDNKPVKLSDFRGKKVVVLAFFVAAFTGGWTKELTAYQSGIANFDKNDAQVIAISTDFTPTLKHWKQELNASYPILSDHMRKVSEQYGILITQMGVANRATFVIDKDGKIANIEEGSGAIDTAGADAACSRLAHKNQ